MFRKLLCTLLLGVATIAHGQTMDGHLGGNGQITGPGDINGHLYGNGDFTVTGLTPFNITSPMNGQCLVYDSTSQTWINATCTSSGTGTVTSVGLSAPSWLAVSGSPVITSGVLALSAATGQTANEFLATPNGTTGAVGLRTIVAADLPGSITSNTSGNASTATALASAPATCGGIQFSTGINTTGNASCRSIASGDLPTNIASNTSGNAATATSATSAGSAAVLSSPPTQCPGQQFSTGIATTGNANCRVLASNDIPATIAANTTGNAATATALASTLNVAGGGTGATTLSGVLKGNGTSAIGSALASDVVSLFSTCSGVQYLGADGACHNSGGSGTVTSITAGTGLSGGTITTSGTIALLNPVAIALGGTGVATAPTAGQTIVGTAGGAYVPQSISGDATLAATGALTVTKTNGVAFAASATTDTTNAGNISSGVLAMNRGGTGTSNVATSAQIPIGNGSSAYLPQTVSGDATISSIGALTVTATNGVAFAASATTNALNASNISSGTLAAARGGTGSGSLTAHAVLLGNGSSTINGVGPMAADTLLQGQGASADPIAVAVNNCGSSTTALSYSTSTHTFGCQTITGSNSAGGSNTQVQFNSSGTLAGDAGFTYVGSTTQTITLGTATQAPTISSTTSSGAGGTFSINGQRGAATSNGGDSQLMAGNGGATSGNGGKAVVGGGSATGGATAGQGLFTGANSGSNTTGGYSTVYAGNGIGSGAGGNFTVNYDVAGSGQVFGGVGGATGNGGSIALTGGKGGATSGNGGQADFHGGNSTAGGGQGGALAMSAGNGATSGAGGAASLSAGNGGASGSAGSLSLAAGSAGTGNGGNVTINATAGGCAGCSAGTVGITAGNGSSTTTGAAGGTITVTGGNAGGSGNNAGGSVVLVGGTSTGTGAHGTVQAQSPIVSTGTKFTTSGCSVSSTTGGSAAGVFTLGANTCTVVITINGATGTAAPNGWSCDAHDRTAPTTLIGGESSSTTTTASITIPVTAGATDVISFSCTGY